MLFSPQLIARRPVIVAGGGGGGGTTFDAATLSNASLSNGNLTATRTNTSAGGAASTNYKSAGKFYFEVTIGASSGNTDFIGIKDAATTYGTIVGGGAGNYAGYWRGNAVCVTNNGSGFGNIGSGSPGDVISVAIDMGNLRAWIRRNGGQWNGSPTADPAANNGGGGSISGSVAPAIGFSTFGSPTTGDNFTANFGASAFVYAVPSGFTAGWT